MQAYSLIHEKLSVIGKRRARSVQSICCRKDSWQGAVFHQKSFNLRDVEYLGVITARCTVCNKARVIAQVLA